MLVDRVPMEVTFTERCWSCRDTNNRPTAAPTLLEDDGKTCSVCKGFGFNLSQLGNELVDLLVAMGVVLPKTPRT